MIEPDVKEDPLFDERPTLPDLSQLDDDEYDASPSYPGDYDAFDPAVVGGEFEPEEED